MQNVANVGRLVQPEQKSKKYLLSIENRNRNLNFAEKRFTFEKRYVVKMCYVGGKKKGGNDMKVIGGSL